MMNGTVNEEIGREMVSLLVESYRRFEERCQSENDETGVATQEIVPLLEELNESQPHFD
jgi:hypothetical protein